MTEEDLQKPLNKKRSVLYESEPMLIYYQVQIKARIKKQIKNILHPQTGIFPSHSFTAILGTSGSGKTTLLNFLAGRLMSNNLTITGEYKLNSVSIRSIDKYCKEIGYVMQQDSLLGMLTPKQCLLFAAGLRLPYTKNNNQSMICQKNLDYQGTQMQKSEIIFSREYQVDKEREHLQEYSLQQIQV